jgi:hypothetical protein
MVERIATIQRDNLQRLEDDLAIPTRYLKAQGAPATTINVLKATSMRAGRRPSIKSRIY